jgi:hypothetical protein
MPSHSVRSTLDAFQRLFYAAREAASAAGGPTHFAARMNGDTLKELGREVAMGGVVAQLSLPAACEDAAAGPDGPTAITLWDVVLVLDNTLGDGEIRIDEAPPAGEPAEL